jgi:hypothetical protein
MNAEVVIINPGMIGPYPFDYSLENYVLAPLPISLIFNPFVLGNQHTSTSQSALKDWSVPISFNAFHSPIGAKWATGTSNWFDRIWTKIVGVSPKLILNQYPYLANAWDDLGWVPSVRSSDFWTTHGLPAYDSTKKYSKWDNIPVGLGISPDKAGALVGIIVTGNTPVYVWRRTDEELSLDAMTLPDESPFNDIYNLDDDGNPITDPELLYKGHVQSFESNFEDGFAHCNDTCLQPAEYRYTASTPYTYLPWHCQMDTCSLDIDKKPQIGFVGWADEMEYEWVDQLSGPGTRKLTHIGRDVQKILIYEAKGNPQAMGGITHAGSPDFAVPPGPPNYPNMPNTILTTTSELFKDYKITGAGDGMAQVPLDVPIFVVFSREHSTDIPTERKTYAHDWPYPAMRVLRNNFATWGSNYDDEVDPDYQYTTPNSGSRARPSAVTFSDGFII